MNATLQALHEQAVGLAKTYLNTEKELIMVLEKIDDQRVFRVLGYSSLYQYATTALKLSEGCAFNFITVMRKAREIPEMKAALDQGTLSVTKARRITPVIQKDNAQEWIQKAQELPRQKLEQAVAKICPKVQTPEKSHYVTENRIAVSLGLSEAAFQQLKKVQDLLSQKLQKAASMEDAIVAMTQCYIEKNDPVVKAKRASQRMTQKSTLVPKPDPGQVMLAESGQTELLSKREPIPALIRHNVNLRDGGVCTYKNSNGERCTEKRWLDLHHLRPVHSGGDNQADNLVTLCKTHHRLAHQFGLGGDRISKEASFGKKFVRGFPIDASA